MKIKILLTFSVFILSNSMLNAQDYRHEVSLGYGLFNTSDIVNVFSDIIVTGITGGNYKSENSRSTGTFHLGYKYALSEHLALGGIYAYTNNTSDAVINNIQEGEFRNNYHTVAAEFEYRYINNPKITLYSAVGAGITVYSQKYLPFEGKNSNKNIVHPDAHLSLLGLRFGSQYGFFAEGGFGYKGILNIGVFTRF